MVWWRHRMVDCSSIVLSPNHADGALSKLDAEGSKRQRILH